MKYPTFNVPLAFGFFGLFAGLFSAFMAGSSLFNVACLLLNASALALIAKYKGKWEALREVDERRELLQVIIDAHIDERVARAMPPPAEDVQ